MKICKLCGGKFKDYQNKARTRCGSCNTKVRRYRAKAAAIKYLGGKCRNCGWQGNQAAFEFHHTDPGKKDFIIGNVANKRWEFIKAELEKCILLCAICHSVEHSTKTDKLFLQEVNNYRGRKLKF
jgi:hypothetical protein